MAFSVIPQLNPGSANANGRFTFDTAAATALDGCYIPAGYEALVSFTASASTASASDIQVTTSPKANIDAGTAIWVTATGLNAIGVTAKQAGVAFPITAFRVNVTGALAGTLTVDVLVTSYQGLTT